MDIGSRLKFARKSIGFTLAQAEAASGIGRSSLSEFETNTREPRFSQLAKLAEVYQRAIEFFLTESTLSGPVMLWREKPSNEEGMKPVEAQFRQLCEQYHRLEASAGEVRRKRLPELDVTRPGEFGYADASSLARKTGRELGLGELPGGAIRQVLEETYHVKLFYLDFAGSAVSTVSEEFGPAVLLNRRNRAWRRNYDLAHELFHILTWTVFRTDSERDEPSEMEEKWANAFASTLLMPDETVRSRVESLSRGTGAVGLDQLDDIARELGVSMSALIYRIASIYRFDRETVSRYAASVEAYLRRLRPRESDEPAVLPERYCDLAQRALREGKLSLIQFAKYMGISYRQAQEYLVEDEGFTDEKISIPAT